MAVKTMKYSLEDVNQIIFNGFDFKLPDQTLEIISNLALQVGSPDYVKTPVFQKRENPLKSDVPIKDVKKGKRGKAMEIIKDEVKY